MSDYLNQVLSWFKGEPKSQVNLAPPLSSYPTNADAENARHYGFSQGNENQDYLDNQKARVLGLTGEYAAQVAPPPSLPQTNPPLPQPDPRKQFLPISGNGQTLDSVINPLASKVVDPSTVDLSDKTNNVMMRAALAANRSPIAALGFDPSKVIMDTKMGHSSLGGAYNAKPFDSIYTNLNPDDSVVHESTHRGIQKLRELYPDQVNKIMNGTESPPEETIVRWLMHSQGGDPEGNSGMEDAKERQNAIDTYNSPYIGNDYKNNLNQLQELAIEAMKNRGKRVGPQ
jgi:hypothetical protein